MDLDQYDTPATPPETTFRDEDRLTPGEVAALFRVDPKTVTRWALAGRIPDDPDTDRPGVIRTPGGHTRYLYKVIRLMLEGKLELTYAGQPVAPTARTPQVTP